MGLGDAKVGEQEGDRLGGHGGVPVGMDGQLPRADALVQQYGVHRGRGLVDVGLVVEHLQHGLALGVRQGPRLRPYGPRRALRGRALG